ncbi:S-layer homology domain-containing protein [Bacillus benzoevorans]|uniref:Lysophospholipase L1-like esterase n=1 Tax=Bacillus benzoevorans TaxID=1456 RepID=A0A7X0LVW6_9BACI|nr:S-layer homology domain-containing protein [Bacillus benzoevorans]MBB6446053.1 lysophospholipase L1-like esterase [Bacillus benzoevorans]
MRKWKKLCCAFAIGCAAALSPFSAFAAENDKLDYLALGDSLAAGQTPVRTIDKGYTDYLGSQLNKVGALSSFDKRFAVSGYTTTDVLADIQANKSVSDNSGNTVTIETAIANAEVITIDAGANDILKEIAIDKEKLEVNMDPGKVNTAILTVGVNTSAILAKIKTLNPNADVYVMGYYNPFTILPAQYQTQFQTLLNALNQTIANSAKLKGAVFVPTAAVFAKNTAAYMPNPMDIHPNQDGYLVIANAFWKALDVGKETNFSDIANTTGKNEIEKLAGKGIISGYANGQFAPSDSITRAQSAIMLNRAIVYSDAPAINPNYADVNESSFAYDAIAKMTEAKVFSGSNNQFNPDQQLTRAQMARVLVEAFDLTGTAALTFKDVAGDHWAKNYISILAENGITVGYNDGSFKPNKSISRAEFSIMLAKALEK